METAEAFQNPEPSGTDPADHPESPNFDRINAFQRPDLPHSIITKSLLDSLGLSPEPLSTSHACTNGDGLYSTCIGSIRLQYRKGFCTLFGTFLVVESAPHRLILGREECNKYRQVVDDGVYTVIEDPKKKKDAKMQNVQNTEASQRQQAEKAKIDAQKDEEERQAELEWEEQELSKDKGKQKETKT